MAWKGVHSLVVLTTLAIMYCFNQKESINDFVFVIVIRFMVLKIVISCSVVSEFKV